MITPLLKPSQQKKRRKFTASGNADLAFPKGPTRRQEKDAYDAEEAAHIRAVRAELFAKELRCYDCKETQEETTRRFLRNGWAAPSEHHMDEERSRAQTRGMHYRDRFSLEWCRRRCPTCHSERHGIKIIKERSCHSH